MPTYDFTCPNGHTAEVRATVETRAIPCSCGESATRQLSWRFGFRMSPEGLLSVPGHRNDGIGAAFGPESHGVQFGPGTSRGIQKDQGK